MKKNIIWIIIIAVLAILFLRAKGIYNSMVTQDEGVSGAWSQVENVYQRRADLIPNLVSTVKGYAEHEKETLDAVISARAKATQMNVNAENLTPEQISEFQANQGGLSNALGRLMVVAEQYPNLKANENFRDLQAQLEGTENRITVERKKFNDAAKAYNTYIRRFPNNLFAGMFGFDRRAYFESDEGAETAPEVQF